ncbi:uncharacterized protein BT62DRAFT_999567 [Guyanagaster necrorhizus]|uniref:Uncharacterized protein n=1 Tax=Guyanagaster necrorhizus TaxID=856835 RepID=A0A9P8AXQ4_9AGAR|nr:uncharacterized protein BT62DRAFT_999567 [Guyanagaster necrorhizus MCA 3950]KAG7451848.1 hypothetical protein BT62DRAFT_999567 [Guyanagaster necrorhizus MCA 3950]
MIKPLRRATGDPSERVKDCVSDILGTKEGITASSWKTRERSPGRDNYETRGSPQSQKKRESGGKKTRATQKTSMDSRCAPTTLWNTTNPAGTQDTLAKYLMASANHRIKLIN